MDRSIIGYHRDELGEWVGELDCGHHQHLRHHPPFQLRAWVLDQTGRNAHLGALLACPLCDRAELPDGLIKTGSSRVFDNLTMPAGLLKSHRLPTGRWGLLRVLEGTLRFRTEVEPSIDEILKAGSAQAISPNVPHHIEVSDSVSFHIDWLEVARSTADQL